MLDTISTSPETEAGLNLAESTSKSELERQAADELRRILIGKAKRERAESAAFLAAATADPAGARIEPGALLNRCNAAVAVACKGGKGKGKGAARTFQPYNLSATDWTEVRDAVYLRSLALGRKRDATRTDRCTMPGCDGPAFREWRQVGRACRLHAEHIPGGRMILHPDRRTMPRADHVSADLLLSMARECIADLFRRSEDRPSQTGDLPDVEAARWGGDLTAEDLAAGIEQVTGKPCPERAKLALRLDLAPRRPDGRPVDDADSVSTVAVESGRNIKAVENAANRGRSDLRSILAGDTFRAVLVAAEGEAVNATPEGPEDALAALIAARIAELDHVAGIMIKRPGKAQPAPRVLATQAPGQRQNRMSYLVALGKCLIARRIARYRTFLHGKALARLLPAWESIGDTTGRIAPEKPERRGIRNCAAARAAAASEHQRAALAGLRAARLHAAQVGEWGRAHERAGAADRLASAEAHAARVAG